MVSRPELQRIFRSPVVMVVVALAIRLELAVRVIKASECCELAFPDGWPWFYQRHPARSQTHVGTLPGRKI